MDEGLCTRCGRCCILKREEGALSRLTERDCPFLTRDIDGKGTCTVYEDRLVMRLRNNNVCIPMEEALKEGDLPPDCPYALATPGYQTNIIDWR